MLVDIVTLIYDVITMFVGITILLSLSVFSLIVAESVPSTSLAVPLLGKRTCCQTKMADLDTGSGSVNCICLGLLDDMLTNNTLTFSLVVNMNTSKLFVDSKTLCYTLFDLRGVRSTYI